MTRESVLVRLCVVANRVMNEEFKLSEPADCFCGQGATNPAHFHFSESVMRFIEDAVDEKLKQRIKSAAIEEGERL